MVAAGEDFFQALGEQVSASTQDSSCPVERDGWLGDVDGPHRQPRCRQQKLTQMRRTDRKQPRMPTSRLCAHAHEHCAMPRDGALPPLSRPPPLTASAVDCHTEVAPINARSPVPVSWMGLVVSVRGAVAW